MQSCHQGKLFLLKNLKYETFVRLKKKFFVHRALYVLFNNFDVLSFVLRCSKTHERVGVSKQMYFLPCQFYVKFAWLCLLRFICRLLPCFSRVNYTVQGKQGTTRTSNQYSQALSTAGEKKGPVYTVRFRAVSRER